MLELAKSLKLVAPITMTADAQMVWLQAAADALEDIRPEEVKAISAELRRSVTRPSQIVPEISKLVAQKRARANVAEQQKSPWFAEMRISQEAQAMRAAAGRGRKRQEGYDAEYQAEIEAAWQWERDERIAAGLPVASIEPPLTRKEIANLSPAMVKMGLSCGALAERDGQIVNAS